MLRAFFGRHKTASTWARSILHDAAHALGLKVLTLHVPAQWAGHATVGDYVRAQQPDLLVMTNVTQAQFDTLPPLRGLNVIRDPRDIIVSGYFSHLHSHPEKLMGNTWTELVEHRRVLTESDTEAGLLAEIEFSGLFLDPMREWTYANPGVLELRMEDMVADPLATWTSALTHLDLLAAPDALDRVRHAACTWNLADRRATPHATARVRRFLPRLPLRRLPQAYAADALARFSFERLSQGRRPGEEDVHSHYRRGVAGDWRNHLTEVHLKAIDARYGDIVQQLGYAA
ncbi:sulfotransferase family protein [Catellatospora vulcania]|uniref:sulfotransferase domain-containing protein n=1 Tax=Catellatospora vulcania TaxID=1460450 RepID=UPI0012D4BB90|nr:sulfotransferase domain-containing protein [Catellatospora vulcania]